MSDGYQPLQPRPAVTSATRGQDGASIGALAKWFGCTKEIAKRVVGEPIGFGLYAHTGRVYDLYDVAAADELLHHPEVVKSRARRANRVTTKKRINALWKIVGQYDLSHAKLVAIQVENYKSIGSATIPVGFLSVLIGPNGAGKTNLLEALALTTGPYEFATGRLSVDEARILRSNIDPRERAASASEQVHYIFEIGQQQVDGVEDAVDYALSRSPLSDSSTARNAMIKAMHTPHIGVSSTGKTVTLFAPRPSPEIQSSPLSLPTAVKSTDPFIANVATMVADRTSDWVKILEVERSIDLPTLKVRVLDTDPEKIQQDIYTAVESIVKETDRAQDSTHAPIETGQGDVDLSLRLWIRWVDLSSSAEGHSNGLVATMTPDMLMPAAGSATHLVYGTGDVLIENIVDSTLLRDRWDVERLFDRIHADGAKAGWIRAIQAWVRDEDWLDFGIWANSPLKAPLLASFFELSNLDQRSGGTIDLSKIDGWMHLTESGVSVRDEVLDAIKRIEFEANHLAPRFVQKLGRIVLDVQPATEWDSGDRIKVSVMPADLPRRLPLGAVGRGAQRWIAASIREATRRLTRPQPSTSVSPDILVIDEPGMALHPAAQEEVAAWCIRAARDGQYIVVATHSPAFLDLSPSVASVSSVQNIGGQTIVTPIGVEALAGLDRLGEALGLGRSTLMFAVRGFLAVEGPADVEVLNHLMGPALREHRIIPVPLHGFPGVSGLVQPHLFEALGRPVAVMLDDVQRSVVEGQATPATGEGRMMMKVIRARDSGLPITAISLDAPDIMCALPEDAVRRVRPYFTSWDDLINSHNPADGNFKKHAMDKLNWKRNDDRGFISKVLSETAPEDPLPPAFIRSSKEILAWAEGLSMDRELDLPGR